jgi:hypothetical protein
MEPMIARRALPIARLIDRGDGGLFTRGAGQGYFHVRFPISPFSVRAALGER